MRVSRYCDRCKTQTIRNNTRAPCGCMSSSPKAAKCKACADLPWRRQQGKPCRCKRWYAPEKPVEKSPGIGSNAGIAIDNLG